MPVGGGGDAGGGAAMENPVDAATAGNIAGSIVFEGDAPSMDAIDMTSEAVCAAKHSSTPMVQEVVVNGNGTLANVFVYVKEGLESLQFPENVSRQVRVTSDHLRWIDVLAAVSTVDVLRKSMLEPPIVSVAVLRGTRFGGVFTWHHNLLCPHQKRAPEVRDSACPRQKSL